MMYPDTRPARYGRGALGSAYSETRRRVAGRGSRIIFVHHLAAVFTRDFFLSVAGAGVALVPCTVVLGQHENMDD